MSDVPTIPQARMPSWLKRKVPSFGKKEQVASEIALRHLHTVCTEAKCPNRGECFSKGTATFLILGDVCSRNCAFCGVTHGSPTPPNPSEPSNIVAAAKSLNLTYVVITSVTRDDLPDGGATHFANCVSLLKKELPLVGVEILTPDFKGDTSALDRVLKSGPDVFNHNIETVPSLYATIRPQAEYNQSLSVLLYASLNAPHSKIKSGLMLGLGETEKEVEQTLLDLKAANVSIVTIGQYLRPSKECAPVVEYITPELFLKYEKMGRAIGFKHVLSGSYVRSSYHAETIAT